MPLSASQLISELIKYKYFLLYPGAVFEGPVITVIAGFLASLGYFNIFAAYAVIVIGDLTGDALHYAVGFWGREKFVKRWGRYIGIDEKRVIKLENGFRKHGGKVLFVGKISHGVGGAFLVAAGLAKMPFWEFIWSNAIATFLKSLILLLIGFYFGEFIEKINSFLELIGLIFVGIAIIVGLIYFFYYPKGDDIDYV